MTEFTFGQLDELRRLGILDSVGYSLFTDERNNSLSDEECPGDPEETKFSDTGFAAIASGVTHAVCIDLRAQGDSFTKPLVSTFFTDGVDGFFAEPYSDGWRISDVVPVSSVAFAIASFTSQEVDQEPEFILLELAEALALFRAAREPSSERAAAEKQVASSVGSDDLDLDKLVTGQRLNVVRRGVRETAVSNGASNLAMLATGSVGFVGEPGSMYVCSVETEDEIVFQQVDVEVAAGLLAAMFEPIQLPPMLPVSISAGSFEIDLSTMQDPADRPMQLLTFGPIALREIAGRLSTEESVGWEAAIFRPEFVISWSTREEADIDGAVSISGNSEFVALRAFSSDGMLVEIRRSRQLPGMLHRALQAAYSLTVGSSDTTRNFELQATSIDELLGKIEQVTEKVGIEETTISSVSCLRMMSDGLIHGEQFEIVWLKDKPTSYIDRQDDKIYARPFVVAEVTSQLLHTLAVAT